MSQLTRLWSGLLALFRRQKAENDLDEELRGFFDGAVEARVAAGDSVDAARRSVRLEVGRAESVKDWVSDIGWERHLLTVWQDIRYAFRILRRSRGFAVAVILTFAVGVGANTAIFSIVDAAILRPLPYDASDRLVDFRLVNRLSGRTSTGVSARDFLDWRDKSTAFERIAMTGGGAFTLLGAREPEQVRVSRVTGGFFELMHVKPAAGRLFTEADEVPGHAQIVVLTYEFWQSRLGGAPDVIGRVLRLDDHPYEIVGVLPDGFSYPAGRLANPLFLPLSFDATDRQTGVAQSMGFSVIGRLRNGISVAAAQSAMSQLQSALDEYHVSFNKGYSIVHLTPMLEWYVGDARPWMLMLLGAVACVLLIACANVANLFIAHGTTRVRELTVRGALGASRSRIARQLLAESMVLTTIGAAAGVAIAWWTLDLLRGSLPSSIPRSSSVTLDWRVFGITSVISIATGILCGLYPALQGSRVDLVRGLKDDAANTTTATTARQRVRYGLAWIEMALATMLLVGAGLMIASFARVLNVEKGFDASNIVSLEVVFDRRQQDDRTKTELAAILTAVHAQQVEASLVVTGSGPFEGGYMTTPLRIVERGSTDGTAPQNIGLRKVSAGFLDMLHVPLRAGRHFSAVDTERSVPVTIVNDAAVRQFWDGRSPLGQHLEIGKTVYEIVGVVGDMRYRTVTSAPVPEAYIPYLQSTVGGSNLLIRAERGTDIVPAIKAAIWSVNPNLPVPNVKTADQLFARATAPRRFNMLIMSVFAALAVLIAATGVYGVLSLVVTQRRREIGVRMALGATSTAIVRMFIIGSSGIIFGGIAIGVAGAWLLARSIQSFLFEVQPRDPAVFASVAVLLATVGLMASWLPGRRAVRIDPVDSLRSE